LFLSVIEAYLKQGTRVIAVGDTYQSIYGWRGAIKAMDKLKELLNKY
jgi:superfamily I DNA/RNA helicase